MNVISGYKLSKENSAKLYGKKLKKYNNLSSDNIFSNKQKSLNINTKNHYIPKLLDKKTRNNSSSNFFPNYSAFKIIKKTYNLTKYKNLNEKNIFSIFSNKKLGNIYEGYSMNKKIRLNDSSINCDLKKRKKITIKGLKSLSNSNISLITPIDKSKILNISKPQESKEDPNIYTSDKQKKKFYLKRFSLDKLLLQLNYPEETFEDFIQFSNNSLRKGVKYKRFSYQLFDNRKKIEKIIQNMDFKIVNRNKRNKSYIPDLLKKKYFLNSVFKYKLNK